MYNWRIKQLLELHEQDPEDDFVLFAIAQEYHKVDDLDKSVEMFEKLRLKNPQYIGLYYHLAAVYQKLEEPAKAENIYKIGIALAQELSEHHALAELKNAYTNHQLEL